MRVFPEWMDAPPMQQQSVLLLAARGPDGVAKFHPTKVVWRHYRASVLKAAYFGRALRSGEGGGNEFMTLETWTQFGGWRKAIEDFFANADGIPHHCRMHLMHGAEILGYKHPDAEFRAAWSQFYIASCDDLHLAPESEERMDARLSDWHRKYWDQT